MRLFHKLALAIVLMSLLAMLFPISVAMAQEIVTFPDPNLETAIREAIGKPTGDIYQSDLVGLTGLDASSRGIVNLTGLEHCTSLNWLSLNNNQISDISPLSNLTNLGGWLNLHNNKISDISPLSNLTILWSLHLEFNQISDVSPLANLNHLDLLWIFENRISDISPLSNLANLKTLAISWNAITDISPLSSLTNLEGLYLYNTGGEDNAKYRISDISVLSNLTKLRYLGLTGNRISDISALANLTSLDVLYLGSNQITDIQPLVDNTGLSLGDTLELDDNPLNSVSIDNYISQLKGRGVNVTYSTPNTPTGSNVVVDPLANVSPGVLMFTFQTVSAKGHTILRPYWELLPEWGPTPSGIQVPEGEEVAAYFDIFSGATYSGPVCVEIHYGPVPPQVTNESGLRIFNWNGAQWEDVTTSVDTVNNIIYFELSSLSPFFGGELLSAQLATATGSGTATFSPASGTIENLTAVPESALPAEGKPDLVFPHGFFEFEITGLTPGETVNLNITLPSAAPVGTQYWKYGPTPSDPTNHWYQIPMGDDDGDNVITITLVDGGLGDDDLAANGVIVDQGEPGNPPSGGGGGFAPLPVFPDIYIGIAAVLGAGVLAYFVRRRFVRQEYHGD